MNIYEIIVNIWFISAVTCIITLEEQISWLQWRHSLRVAFRSSPPVFIITLPVTHVDNGAGLWYLHTRSRKFIAVWVGVFSDPTPLLIPAVEKLNSNFFWDREGLKFFFHYVQKILKVFRSQLSKNFPLEQFFLSQEYFQHTSPFAA